MTSRDDKAPLRGDLSKQHRLAMRSLTEYDTFLDIIKSEAEDLESGTFAQEPYFSDFEDYAALAVQSFLETGQKSNGEHADVLAKHDCAAVAATPDGYIRQLNEQARLQLGLAADKSLEECKITLLSDTDEPALQSLQHDKLGSAPFHILQARSANTDRYLTAAVSRMPAAQDAEALFLILFISPPDASLATQILAQKFGFTKSEADIAKAFLDGIPLREIAALRERSYTTIRNQFQSVLDKSGCDSQTAFFRLAYSLLQLADHTQKVEPKAHPTQARFLSMPRPKGRVVEIALCGDEMGQPVLSFPSLFGHGMTADIEALLRKRKVLLISVMRPGFAGTSPVPSDESLFDCTAADVAAILNSLEIDRCPLIARASAARPFYNLLSRLPDRLTHGVIANGLVPRNYIAGKTVASKWTTALMSVSILSYPVAKLILGTGNSLLMRSKGGSFLQKMYQGSNSDQAVLSDPNVVHSIKSGVKAITAQGLTSGVEEIVDGFRDWADELDNLGRKVILYHGADDPNVPIAAVEEFAKSHPQTLTLLSEPQGGGQLGYSHFSKIIDLALEEH
mgnify:FL=1